MIKNSPIGSLPGVCRIKTGSYTGDGSEGLSISGIGFTPKLLMINNEPNEYNATDNFSDAQDTANYTESDPAGRVVKTSATLVTVTNADDDEEFYIAYDFGVNYWDGDFEFRTQINCTSNAASGDRCGLWALTNTLDSLTDIDVANGDYLSVVWVESGGNDLIVLYECNGGTLTSDVFVATKATEYYLKIVRNEKVGTYGTIYCYIYSNAAMTTLVDTLVVVLTEKQNFRYLNWVVAYESGGAGRAWNGTIQNLKIIKPYQYIFIKLDQSWGVYSIMIQSSDTTADNAKIPFLDTDGFTVTDGGIDSHPNQTGQTYNYTILG